MLDSAVQVDETLLSRSASAGVVRTWTMGHCQDGAKEFMAE